MPRIGRSQPATWGRSSAGGAELAECSRDVARALAGPALSFEHDRAHGLVDRGQMPVQELLGVVRLGRDERALAELERGLLRRGPVAAGPDDQPALLVGRLDRR